MGADNNSGFLIKLLSSIGSVLAPLLGRFDWSPPSWIERLDSEIHSGSEWLKTHRRATLLTLLATVFVIGAIQVGFWWYQNQPRPAILMVTGTSPAATPLKEDAKPEAINIFFSGSAAQLDHVGKPVTTGVSISPAIAGEWRWQSDTQLAFTPGEDWGVGEEYTVTLDKMLFPDHVRLNTYEYEFKSAPFNAQITKSEFYQDPRDPKMKKVVVNMKFSHPVDPKALEDRISFVMEGQKQGLLRSNDMEYKFTVTYDAFKGEAYLQSDVVEIPPKNSYMLVKVDDGLHAERGGPKTRKEITARVWIPGMFNFFRVRSAEVQIVRNEKYEPEQVLMVDTTAGVQGDELRKNLDVFVLPMDRPAIQGRKAVKNYHWHDSAEIGPEVLAESTPLDLEVLPTDLEYATLHSYRFKAEVGRKLYVRLKKGVRSHGGYVLSKTFDTVAGVPAYPKELKVMHEGAVLSLSGSKKLSIYARGLKAVKMEVGRVLPNQINHLVTQTSGAYKNPSFQYSFSDENITARFEKISLLDDSDPTKAQYTSFDFNQYLRSSVGGQQGLFFLRVMGWDPVRERVTGMQDRRLILITDLGILVKDNVDGSHDVFVQGLSTGQPASSTRVDVLGKNGISIVSEYTGPNGHVQFPKLSDFKREQQPTVYVVQRDSDLAFLPYDRRDRALNFSRFDTGGETNRGESNRLGAYLFSDRGIYRPGDTFNIGLVVKPADWRKDLSGVPLEVLVTDARGLTVKKQKLKLSAAGFEEINYTTEETSPTGNYRVSAYIIKDGRRSELLGSTEVKVEEFLPDRLEIVTRFSTERVRGWVAPEDLTGKVTLKNLFGTPAIERRIAGQVSLKPAYPTFKGFREYNFYDPLRTKKSFSERLPDTKTDDNGEAILDLGLDRFEKASYYLTFTAEGYEAEGGRGVSSESSVMVSPLRFLLGFKPDGKLTYVKRGSERRVHLLAVDSMLEPVEIKALKTKLVEQRYVSVLTRQPNGTFKYQSVRKEIPVSDAPVSIDKGGVDWRLDTKAAGDYALVIQDQEGTELNRIEYSVAGDANLARELERNAELKVKLDREDYAPGDTISLQITAPYTGAGLITIERDRVYTHKWFKTSTTSSVQTIQVPFDLEGNGYINVSFVRGMDSKEVFMSPLSYGVVPFSVSKERRRVNIELDTPQLVRPGETLSMKYSTSKPARIAIFAVDEGILQVADYSKPDPLSHFFRKRALEVTTTQILDLLLPEYELVRSLSAAGGGEGYGAEAIGKNLNPFKRKRQKPAVYWSGIVDADTTTRELKYTVPDYFNGTMRVLAVAVAPDALGSTTRKSVVRGHFVLSPNVPTFAAPGDEFIVSVGVANNVEGSGKQATVNLDLVLSEHLEIVGEKATALKIDEGKETSATYKVRAKDKLGAASIRFSAAMGDKRAKYDIGLSVRPPVPYRVTVAGGSVLKDQIDVPVSRRLYPHYRELEASASPLPLGLARGLIRYLDKFPYGCTEQTVSKAFPAIILRDRPDFGYAPEQVETALSRTLHVLQSRQNAEGAFGFWAANSHVSDEQTVYAMHFLTHAKEVGYAIPAHVLRNGIKYLQGLAQQQPDQPHDARTQAYAIYVLTRNGVVTTRQVASLRRLLDAQDSWEWQNDITAAYLASTYAMLKLRQPAEKLIGNIKLEPTTKTSYAHFYDSLSRNAQILYLLARHFPERAKSLPADAVMQIATPVTQGRFNTISSAYAILALDAYADVVGVPQAALLSISELQKEGKVRPLVMPKGLFPKVAFTQNANQIRIDSKSAFPMFYQVTQAGFDNALPNEPVKQMLEVQREYRAIEGGVLDTVKLGDEVEVHVKLRSIDDRVLQNIAVVDLLPGGFEAVLSAGSRSGAGTNSEGGGPGLSTWSPQYVDLREDRVVLFGSVGPKARKFIYRIKATNRGHYSVPPVFAESMYNRDVQARALGGKMTVE